MRPLHIGSARTPKSQAINNAAEAAQNTIHALTSFACCDPHHRQLDFIPKL